MLNSCKKFVLGMTVATSMWGGPVLANDVYFTMDGKEYKFGDLGPAVQQNLYEIDFRGYKQKEQLLDEALLDIYFNDKAKKANKSKEEVEVEELKVGDIKEGELKKFYEENKNRIPPDYTYDKVKPEIQRLLENQKRGEKRTALLEKLKKEKKYKMVLREPDAPKMTLNTADFPKKGKSGAKVQIVEFADYQCPHCKAASAELKRFMKDYEKKVELVFVDFPINKSGVSRTVAEGGYCALQQKKYWEYHEAAFNAQGDLSKDSPEKLAKDLKLNAEEFKKCLGSAEAKSFVSKGKDEGDRVGVGGTPTVFINGKRFTQAVSYEGLKKAVDPIL